MRNLDNTYKTSMIVEKDQAWLIILYLSTFLEALLTFGGFVGPLVIWLLKKKESESIRFHGKNILNFLITFAIFSFILELTVTHFVPDLNEIAAQIMEIILEYIPTVSMLVGALKALDNKPYKLWAIKFLY